MSDNILPADTDTCLVEFDKKEYAIVGDLFFAKTLEEVPPWFQELIHDTVVQVNGNTYDTLTQYNISLLAALQGIEVSKNTYEQYINKLITDQEAFVSVLTTLNSAINDNDASIRQLLLTYATEDFAVASAAQLLTASLKGGAIGARIGAAETAMATQYGAMAQRLNMLESTFDDVAGQQSANATAIQALTTYTGYGVYNGADALIANSNFYSNLNAYLDGTDYNIGGSSTLIQDVTAVSTEKMKQVEAKFEYGSTIELDGKTYNAGFGLVQTGTLLPDGTTYDSEFWVKASRFKFIADDGVTVGTPFEIDGNVVKIGWDSVVGENKPADGATKNQIHYARGVPSNSFGSNNDIYVDQASTPVSTYVKYSGLWVKSGNVITGTDQIADTAGLGTKATWSNVTGSGRPSDNADVTSVKITDSATIAAVQASSSWSTLINNLAAGSITLTRVVQNDGVLTSGTIQSANYSTSSQGWSIGYNGGAYFKGNTYFGSVTANYVSSTGIIYSAGGMLCNGMDLAKTASGTINSGSNTFTLSNSVGYKLVLQQDGNLVWYNGGTPIWSSQGGTSDIRFKDILGLTSSIGLDTINKLKVVDYEWKKSSALYDGGKLHTGFIAQQVKAVHPGLVGNVGDVLVVKYDDIVPILVKSVQELTDKVKWLEGVVNG